MAEQHPSQPRAQARADSYAPAPANTQKQQKKVREIQLLLDRECPEDAVDRVARFWIEVVQHQQMHAKVIKEEVRQVDAGVPGSQEQVARERDQVRRIETAQAALPEWAKANVRLVSRGT